jgi:hypothetical protein
MVKKIDTGTDFITPEFLNILFFQQKNVVIFPYVDLKHLHSLEIFTAGHNIVDLESTALHDLKSLLEFESSNSYSQAPSLYFIYNLDKDKVKEVMSLENIRCILNASENVSELVNGSRFVFFNKKSNQFLNLDEPDLDFEEYLITSSGNKEVLQDTIQKIKVVSSRIFTELNRDGTLDNLPELLEEFDPKYWKKILDFTGSYFDIEIPDFSHQPFPDRKEKPSKNLKDYSNEYTILVSTNKAIGKEFIQLLHDYRSKRVNSSHLGLEQLFNPVELYNYLRNHHWKEGIPELFIRNWSTMSFSQYKLTETDLIDFESILGKLDLRVPITKKIKDDEIVMSKSKPTDKLSHQETKIPSIKDFLQFKIWIRDMLGKIEDHFELPRYLTETPPLEQKQIYIPQPKKNETKKLNNQVLAFVDTTNILNEDKDKNQKLKVENIAKISKELESKGYDYEHIIDANSRHKFNDKQKIEKLISTGKVKQSPYGIEADIYVLTCAKRFEGKIVSNDGFRDHWDKYKRDWIYHNRITCKYMRGEFIILESNSLN